MKNQGYQPSKKIAKRLMVSTLNITILNTEFEQGRNLGISMPCSKSISQELFFI